jgi:hypothetical protein
MDPTADCGAPASYLTLTADTPVYASDGVRLGSIKHVLGDIESDVFNGLVIAARGAERYVAAQRVRDVYERAVVLAMTADEAQDLPGPPAVPPVIAVAREDWTRPRAPQPREPSQGPIRRAWQRIFRRR